MDESCSHEFNPTRFFAYVASISIAERTREVDLHTRFHEWKVSWAHAYLHLFPEKIREHSSDRELEVTNTDSLIHNNSFHLIKGILMSSIDIFISEYSSWDDGTNRWSIVSYDEILHT